MLPLGAAPGRPSPRARNIFSDKDGTLVVSRKRFFSGNGGGTKVREVCVCVCDCRVGGLNNRTTGTIRTGGRRDY